MISLEIIDIYRGVFFKMRTQVRILKKKNENTRKTMENLT